LIGPNLIHPSVDGNQAAISLALLDQRCKIVPDCVSIYKKYSRRR
jgi:hypothetical protein